MISKIIHKILHLLGLQGGRVEVWFENGNTDDLMVGFRCASCGELSNVHKSLFGSKDDPLLIELNKRANISKFEKEPAHE